MDWKGTLAWAETSAEGPAPLFLGRGRFPHGCTGLESDTGDLWASSRSLASASFPELGAVGGNPDTRSGWELPAGRQAAQQRRLGTQLTCTCWREESASWCRAVTGCAGGPGNLVLGGPESAKLGHRWRSLHKALPFL